MEGPAPSDLPHTTCLRARRPRAHRHRYAQSAHDVLPALSGKKLPHRTSHSTALRFVARLARHALPTSHRQRRTRLIPTLIRSIPLRYALPPRFSARRKTKNQKNAKQNAPDSNSSVASVSVSTGAAHFGLPHSHFAPHFESGFAAPQAADTRTPAPHAATPAPAATAAVDPVPAAGTAGARAAGGGAYMTPTG
jgi:hypothetical protein